MYTLYYSPGSASFAVHWALIEMGLPHQLQAVDLAAGQQRSADYRALNPAGVVPTLIAGGKPLVESSAILMALADRHPASVLSPEAGKREQWYRWHVELAGALGAVFRFWFYPSDLGLEEHTSSSRAAIAARIEAEFERIDAYLGAHGPYLLGAKASTADLLLTMYMRWSRNMPKPATNWPNLATLADAMRKRESWEKLYEVEGLTDWRR